MDILFSESDWDSLTESSEDQEELEFLYGGKASSLLCNLEETIGKIDDFLSFERGFLHGDIVCLASDPSGQMGKIVNVDMVVDLETTSGKVIRDVNSKQILKIRSISVGDYVVHDHWLGRVEKVIDSIAIVFDDGTKYDVIALDQENLVPISPNIVDDPQYPYYPGQRVRVKVPTVSKQARWLCGNWKGNHEEGTVCAVKAGILYIDWLGSALNSYGSHNLPSPPQLLDAKNVTLLSCFLHSNWQLGDWCMLPMDNDNILSRKASGKGLNSGEIFVVAKTKTKVDVLWQDGTQSFRLDSHSLLPINIADAHEFWPQQFVLEKGGCEDPQVPLGQKWGVVQSMDAKEKTVKVQWNNISFRQENAFGGEKVEEIVSAYELIEHPDYSFCLGDLVFRFLHDELVSQSKENHLNAQNENVEEAAVERAKYLSCIGNVVGFRNGAVEVKWATGLTTKVDPHEIFRCDKCEGSPLSPPHFDENMERITQQMVDEDIQSFKEKGKELLFHCSMNQGCQKYPWESIPFSLPRSAIGFLTDFASRLFGSLGSTSELGSTDESCHAPEDGNKSRDSHENACTETCDSGTEMQSLLENELLHTSEKMSLTLDLEVHEVDEDNELSSSFKRKSEESFKQFDMVTDCSDHFFLDRAGKETASQVKRSWFKKVQQEWSILEKNLPETIFVRAYEERMDLLRAAIIGAPGTPYHDGIFFFDILLPPEYPDVPPMVHYHSGGLRLNPNLYESGKVCLSLLNTWTGKDSEVWNPQSSTVLQVLVSLQALVLNDKPYFNEAGYDKQMGKTEGEKNSVSYNENAFLLTCRSMIYLLKRPPKHFEGLVLEHFNSRCQNILSTCKAYMEGAPLGFAAGNGNREQENHKGSSTGFKILLSKLIDKLVKAFSDKGIDCGEIVEKP